MTETRRKPNLFIIGAMKSGTTSLHEYLNTHPQIAMSQDKEPGYFVQELTLHRGLGWYLDLFPTDERFAYIGESSTHYTKLPIYQGVPQRLYEFNPDARLLYIMRNPIDRMISHYWHSVRDVHHGGERLPILKAVQKRPDYIAFSNYAAQLRPYIDRFGRQSLYTLTFECLIADPQRELNRIYEWLALPHHPIGRQSQTAHNQKPKEFSGVAGMGLLNSLQYSDAWDKLSPYVPSVLKAWTKKRAYKRIDEHLSLSEITQLNSMVADIHRDQIARLSDLLERDFPEWDTSSLVTKSPSSDKITRSCSR